MWWEVQNEHVGWGSVVEAADAANGSWAETKQSDADPQCGARAFFVCANADGGVSERREDYYELLWMDGRASDASLSQALLNAATLRSLSGDLNTTVQRITRLRVASKGCASSCCVSWARRDVLASPKKEALKSRGRAPAHQRSAWKPPRSAWNYPADQKPARKPSPRPPRARRSTPRRSTTSRASSRTRPTGPVMLPLDFRLPTSGGRTPRRDNWQTTIRSWRPPRGRTTFPPSKRPSKVDGASTRAINMESP